MIIKKKEIITDKMFPKFIDNILIKLYPIIPEFLIPIPAEKEDSESIKKIKAIYFEIEYSGSFSFQRKYENIKNKIKEKYAGQPKIFKKKLKKV